MKKILFLIVITLVAAGAQAQRRYESVLRLVEEHNPMLQAARQHSEAHQLEAHVGTLLPNPEVELSLFRGNPADQGARWDLRVTQSFEMPSVYIRRARLRNLSEQAAQLDYDTFRNSLLKETQLLCAELVYARGVASTLDRQNTWAYELVQLYEKRMEQGDCSMLEYNRVRMQWAEIQDKGNRAVLYAENLYNDLQNMIGMSQTNIYLSEYDTVILPTDFGSWYDTVEMSNPQLRTLQNAVETSQQELQLSRAHWLPEMSVGYVSETVTGAAFRGVAVGMTLPLWSQQRAVKQANAEYTAAHQELEAQRTVTGNTMRSKREKLITLQRNLEGMREAYKKYDSRELLEKALKAGEITLEQYLLQTDYYLQQELTIWEIAYELERGYIDLYAFTL